jgi:pSer/pThr/pTyr-binding forkhead associated (FHA) protein
MVKFDVFLNDNLIHSATFESDVVHIGRDESNDLYVDGLAVAPAHAAVILRGTKNIIKQLNADFPLVINSKRRSKHYLKNDDIITIGKHQIVFNPEEKTTPDSLPGEKTMPEKQQAPNQTDLPEASLKIMTGKHSERIVPLNKNMTRIGHEGVGIIILTRRKEGYFASILELNENIKINDVVFPDEAIMLKNNDIIIINQTPMQFLWAITS